VKKVGIVADNYKLNKFEKELTAAGFTNFKITPFTEDTSAITLYVLPKQVHDVHKICNKVEMHFKQSN
jgi:hypothetical protein